MYCITLDYLHCVGFTVLYWMLCVVWGYLHFIGFRVLHWIACTVLGYACYNDNGKKSCPGFAGRIFSDQDVFH